jgi:hypothetical protein
MYLHLSSLLGPASSTRYAHSRKQCIEAARMLLTRCTLLRSGVNASGGLPDKVLFDCKTNDFVGFTAAVVLLIGLINGVETDIYKQQEDWTLLHTTRLLFATLYGKKKSKLYQQCHDALDALMHATIGSGVADGSSTAKVFIPYFGKISVSRKVAPDPMVFASSSTSPNAPHVQSLGNQQFSQLSEGAFSNLSASTLDAGFEFVPGWDNYGNFHGAEVSLQNPAPMFSGVGSGTTLGEVATVGLEWWSQEMVDIDGDWGMFLGT